MPLFLAMMPMISAEKIKTRSNTLCIRCFPKLQERHFPGEILTGIRPVKMAMGMLESGMKNTEIARYMREQYLVSPEKTALAVTIANRERDILKKY